MSWDKRICWAAIAILTCCASVAASDAGKDAGRALVWTGAGADSLWSNPENWSEKRIPTENDGILLDGTSDKRSTYNAIVGLGREAKGLTVRSITVSPGYQGTFQIHSPGRVTGSVKLAGRLELSFDAHVNLRVEGPDLDLSAVDSLKAEFGRGSFSLAAPITQTFTPPPGSAPAPGLVKSNGGTLKLAGPLNAILLGIDKNSALDLNGHDLTTQLLQIAGPVRNLGGRTITVTGGVGYTFNAFGFMRDSGDALQTLDLAPEKPWRLVVKKEKLIVLYGPREEWEFRFLRCRVGNCDASQSEVPVVLMDDGKGASTCEDAGNNRNVIPLAQWPSLKVEPGVLQVAFDREGKEVGGDGKAPAFRIANGRGVGQLAPVEATLPGPEGNQTRRPPADWLTIAREGEGNAQEIRCTVNPAGMPAGIYTANLSVFARNAAIPYNAIARVVAMVDGDLPLADAVAVDKTRAGLRCEYFPMENPGKDDKPATTSDVAEPAPEHIVNEYGGCARYTGFLDVPSDGVYFFAVKTAANGAQSLHLDDAPVIARGAQGPKCVGLKRGLHRFEFSFGTHNDRDFSLLWTCPSQGIVNQAIPAERFRREGE